MEKLTLPEPEVRYTIGQLALLLRVHEDTIRNWEKAGKIPMAMRFPTSNFRCWTKPQAQKVIDYVTILRRNKKI